MNIQGFFTKKKIIWTIVILLVAAPIVYGIVKPKDNAKNITVESAKQQDIKQTVLATGQVVSSTDLQLSFKLSGVVSRVNVKEGDKVASGQILAELDAKDQAASVTSARGSLASAQANYDKVVSGASSQEVQVAQSAVDSAQVALTNAQNNLANVQQQQNTAVKNAFTSLMNSGIAALPSPSNISTATVTVSGAYTGTDQGVYKITLYNSGTGQRFQVSGLESAEGDVKNTPVPLGKNGLYIQFNGSTGYVNDSWTITIPNTLSSTYITNYNAYQAAIQAKNSAVDSALAQVAAAKSALDQSNANLDLKRAEARPADIASAKAQILSAQGQVQAASSAYENTIVRAPANGTITQVDIKVGELASGLKEVMVLQDISSLHTEANVSEANISNIKAGQPVDVTFDALGADRHFSGVVQTVNPASTLVSGVVNYKVTASVQNADGIKPGMTANMTILVNQKANVITVPSRAVLSHDNKKFVRVIDDPVKKTYHEVEVQTGLEADGGIVEVVSGVSVNTQVVTFIKK